MTLYDVKTVNGKRQIVWNTGRNRGIEEYSARIGDFTKEIERIINEKGRARVLDIGCGYGKVLLELRRLFGKGIETYGINLEPRWTLELTRKFGLAHNIFSRQDIDGNLPKLWIGDSGKGLPYPSNYFDFIISVASMQYVPDKAKLLEECNRVLKQQGFCRIQHAFTKSSLPQEYRCLFEIWQEGRKLDWKAYLNRSHNIQFKTTNKEHGEYLVLKKVPRLRLGLDLVSSIDVHEINPEWWGTKAVYRLK